ncbi:MAG: transcriptional repressor, partial [Endomicrobiia bacterium]
MVAISRATVYNVLKELTEKHLILALPVGQKFHFDAYLEHVHLICEKCGGIYDLYSIPKQKISTKNVDGHIVYD